MPVENTKLNGLLSKKNLSGVSESCLTIRCPNSFCLQIKIRPAGHKTYKTPRVFMEMEEGLPLLPLSEGKPKRRPKSTVLLAVSTLIVFCIFLFGNQFKRLALLQKASDSQFISPDPQVHHSATITFHKFCCRG